jgi:hypothetical protein
VGAGTVADFVELAIIVADWISPEELKQNLKGFVVPKGAEILGEKVGGQVGVTAHYKTS